MEKILENPDGKQGVKNWDELFSLVETGNITTSSGEAYETKRLDEAVDVARATRFNNLDFFTRSEGIRSQAATLFIEETESFDELCTLLTHVESLTGNSGQTYSGEELIDQIKSVEGISSATEEIWGQKLQQITKAHGLRDAVERCLLNKQG